MDKIIAGIGQAARDIIIVVDRYPKYGEKKRVEYILEDGGGPVATALYTVARLGLKARISTIIGDDDSGKFIINSLREVGICTDYVIKRRNAKSHIAYILVERKTGERTIFYKFCTGEDILPSELPPEFFDRVSLLHLDGFQREISIYASEYARRLGIPVMLDAGSYKEYIEDVIKNTTYLVASSAFAAHYGFDGSMRSFNELTKYFNRPHFTITLGQRGSITYHRGEIFRTPVYRVKAVDTTGAGDVFHGALIYGIVKKYPIRKALAFASKVAAIKCLDYGGRRGLWNIDKKIIKIV